MTTRRYVCMAVVFGCVIAPVVAHAQCDGGDAGTDGFLAGTLEDTFPASGDSNVPTDGFVRLRYYVEAPTPSTLCVNLQGVSGCLPGNASIFGSQVVWLGTSTAGSAAPFQANSMYVMAFSDSTGEMFQTTFQTGNGPTSGAPSFAGLTSISIDSSGNIATGCSVGGVDVTLGFNRVSAGDPNASTTPWPDVDVEYVTYETRGPGISGPLERDRVRLVASGSSLDQSAQRTVHLSSSDSSGPVCFNTQAIDPQGRTNENSVEQCIDPTEGNYFAGCTTVPQRGRRSGAVAFVLASLLAGITRGRRRPG